MSKVNMILRLVGPVVLAVAIAACGNSDSDESEVAVAVALTQTAVAMEGEATATPIPPAAPAEPTATLVPPATAVPALENGTISLNYGASVASPPPSVVYAVNLETGAFVSVEAPAVESGVIFMLTDVPPATYHVYARSNAAGDASFFGYWMEDGSGLRNVAVTSGQDVVGVVLELPVNPCQPSYALPASPDGRFPETGSAAYLQQLGCTDGSGAAATPTATAAANVNTGVYALTMGSQHRYDEPWGGDRGDPCEAWVTNNFDDTDPNYRGFNVELSLTNNSTSKVQENWGDTLGFSTAGGKLLKACYYPYDNMGPQPGASAPVTFFTVVPKGDYVNRAELSLNGQISRLCFDGQGASFACN